MEREIGVSTQEMARVEQHLITTQWLSPGDCHNPNRVTNSMLWRLRKIAKVIQWLTSMMSKRRGSKKEEKINLKRCNLFKIRKPVQTAVFSEKLSPLMLISNL